MVRMEKREKVKTNSKGFIVFVVVCFVFFYLFKLGGAFSNFVNNFVTNFTNSNQVRILSSYENSYMESEIRSYARKQGISVDFKYMGDLDIVDELNTNSASYDAIWISNSMWLYMLDNPYLYSDSKSVSISPVVLGIKKSKAAELNLINNKVTNTDILNLIKDKKINYVMNSVTQTNTGATAYLGFLTSLAGNPEVLTEDMLHDETLINNLKDIFAGVSRVSGDEAYLSKMFLNKSDYEAIIASEASLININQALEKENKEQLYLIYPSDGVAINDSTFAFIDNKIGREDNFLKIQNYLLSDDGQKLLENNGQRTWYGGVTSKADSDIFKKDWGIDTTKYLNVTKFPSKKVMTEALNLYIEELRKPTHVVFCLDYSGSMYYGNGYDDLVGAMEYVLNRDSASKDKLQFSRNDKITVITFSSAVKHIWEATGNDTSTLIENIKKESVTGSTALYDAIISGLNILKDESNDYTKTIIAMTDGEINVGSYAELERHYLNSKFKLTDIPIYSITFGNAKEDQLEEIADLSNAKVFDGKNGLLKAFKEVRSYN